MPFDFARESALWLLPLALLPLRRQYRDAIGFSSLLWIAPDKTGLWLERSLRWLAALTMASIIIGLAGPGISGGKLTRTGRGAEVLIMLDRSSSMDAVPRKRVTDGSGTTAGLGATESKNKIARELLTRFVNERGNDRFGLMTFSTRPMLVAAFADHNEAVLSGLAASGVGRGLPKTDMGGALLAAIDHFEQRTYSGSRVILVVSDGGARLDEETRQRIRQGLTRHRIGLYFIYIRSTGSPLDINAAATSSNTEKIGEEADLHRFFLSLESPYRLFQAGDSESMEEALREIDRQQNKPLIFNERIPRQDFSHWFYFGALLAGMLLLFGKTLSLRSWS
ncbi:MAG: vWA domain-containing protein [Burkholderiaceae bacterium]